MTSGIELPITVAVKPVMPPVNTLATDGETATTMPETGGGGLVTVMVAAPVVFPSDAVAVTTKVPVAEGAVYVTVFPDPETVPPVADQVTAVLDNPVTVAVRVVRVPTTRLAVEGDTVTLTAEDGGATVTVAEPVVLPSEAVALTV